MSLRPWIGSETACSPDAPQRARARVRSRRCGTAGVVAAAILFGWACANQPEYDAWEGWLRLHQHRIGSLTADGDFSDLAFLEPLLRGRRIVQLGENGHGVAEFNHVKVRLIKYLHRELGYDVVAFESDLYRCYRANERAPHLTAERLMRACINGVWRTEEVLPLFQYLVESTRSDRPLVLAGFDVIPSGSEVDRPTLLRGLLEGIDSGYAARVLQMDSVFLDRVRVVDTLYIVRNAQQLAFAYDSLATVLTARRREIVYASGAEPRQVELAAQAARSVAQWVRLTSLSVTDHRSSASTDIRDRSMADNIAFLADRLYPGKKLMIWAHNGHVRHAQPGVHPRPAKSMGEWLTERRRGDVYTIGLFMHRGQAARNDRRLYNVSRMPRASLEAILALTNSPWYFVDLLHQTRDSANSWMFTRRPSMADGSREELAIPRDQYDGILFIDAVTPPRYR